LKKKGEAAEKGPKQSNGSEAQQQNGSENLILISPPCLAAAAVVSGVGRGTFVPSPQAVPT